MATFPHTQRYFANTRIATFGKSVFCDFTLFFSTTFNPHTEKSEKAVSRTLNRVRDLVVKIQSVQIGCQMCRVCLLAFSPVSAYRKMSVQGNTFKEVKCQLSTQMRRFRLSVVTAEPRTQRATTP